MKGLMIKCPECGKALNIRTSSRPTACTTKALVYCFDCHIKAVASVQLTDIQQATFKPFKLNYEWQQEKRDEKR